MDGLSKKMQPVYFVAAVSVIIFSAVGIAALTGAIGLVRLRDYFQRMHPPALAYTLGSWSVTLASVIYFSANRGQLALHAWVIIILLAITAPITTMLLARAALFRRRNARDDAPPPLG